MMNCIIVDDEPLALDLLEDNISRIGWLQVVARCRNAAQAAQALQDHAVDLIFCDIQMPGINGLQLVKSLVQKPLVIMVTAYQQFALEGFDLDVVDYLLKPVDFDRFLKACNKAQTLFELLRKSTGPVPAPQSKHLFVYADYNLIKISHSDIIYVEGLKDYVKFYVIGVPRPVLSRVTIKWLEEQLPADRFFRVHKSYMVNLDHIQSIRKGRIKLSDTEVPFSDSYKDAVTRMTGRLI